MEIGKTIVSILFLLLFTPIAYSEDEVGSINFIQRLFSEYRLPGNGICDDGEWFLLNFDCALDEYIFYQMWFIRIIIVISLIMLIRNSSYFPFAVGFIVLLFYMNHVLF